jgi:predicted  nucleic acid-binding Zn-ribbon protein
MSDGSDIFNYIGGGAGIVAVTAWALKGLGGRLVQREDDDKKALQVKLEESQRAASNTEKVLVGLQHDMNSLRITIEQVVRRIEAGAATQDKEISELRSEFKEQLEQLEHRLKADMQRIVSAGVVSAGRSPRRSRT